MKQFQKDLLCVQIYDSRNSMGLAAAKDFAAEVHRLLEEKDRIRVVFAAAPSQNEFLSAIASDPSIDFSRIDAYHMDEYIGLDPHAPQAFGQFLRDRLFSLCPFHSVSYIDGSCPDPEKAAKDYAEKLAEKPIDIVCMGIGENGHIAFNDPAVAFFDDPLDVKKVPLDEICRTQQVHDGCFSALDLVPTHALTLTVPRLVRAGKHFCVVPAPTKATAVKRMLEGPVDESCPCTILRQVPGAVLYLGPDSSALLTKLS